jgi:hypothetical protein
MAGNAMPQQAARSAAGEETTGQDRTTEHIKLNQE